MHFEFRQELSWHTPCKSESYFWPLRDVQVFTFYTKSFLYLFRCHLTRLYSEKKQTSVISEGAVLVYVKSFVSHQCFLFFCPKSPETIMRSLINDSLYDEFGNKPHCGLFPNSSYRRIFTIWQFFTAAHPKDCKRFPSVSIQLTL